MTNEELEFSISQYVDGTLPPTETSALEERLATDAEARELLAQYQKLDELLAAAHTSVTPRENVRWDRLATQISGEIDESSDERQPESYPMPWVRHWTVRVALAACVVMAIGVALRMYSTRPGETGVGVGSGAQANAIVDVTGPQIESTKATAIAEVTIGPAQNGGEPTTVARYADGVVSRPSRVLIASDLGTFDSDAMPY